ncbi:hypothetical protein PHAMO_10035 [Magnetospirillum molischianum DSM 120]|uniref:Uncharacterized protein n=1 Tax=Magnetospirillum molischianum DSM 120 TaxID=1150626 RepID=H8FMM2_MAGML|nr:hypothetical protein PHAMO_10035 [Magnetospirillum molischianum DSM 120]
MNLNYLLRIAVWLTPALRFIDPTLASPLTSRIRLFAMRSDRHGEKNGYHL